MKLHVHERGAGDKVALLIHGGMADHRTWHAVEGRLVERGYHVVAPDLRGHGASDRGEYRPELLADDLAESLPAGADLAIGHSLGGLALALAVERLRPQRVVYSDPGFRLGALPPRALEFMRAMVDQATRETVQVSNPRWSAADAAAEVAGFALFDRRFLDSVARFDGDYLPESPTVPSLVQLADPSLTIDDPAAALLRERGFDLAVVPGAGHCIHRDDLEGFMGSMKAWL
ncbi:alpha/beta hydrolase [Streptomyces sp. ISL-66]|uniref:alpha/beta fold hydrolase n=1 Tax=Streptomyces sp. ISL-66 TaxID=2819186 RepID=UPI001BE6BFFF|nr:alpha/beta hydrolase [Streptomyces sp. ISL-66]MBT2469837.1 alpha/beta hydrolase [Streptomyces sp. ISL-66]